MSLQWVVWGMRQWGCALALVLRTQQSKEARRAVAALTLRLRLSSSDLTEVMKLLRRAAAIGPAARANILAEPLCDVAGSL